MVGNSEGMRVGCGVGSPCMTGAKHELAACQTHDKFEVGVSSIEEPGRATYLGGQSRPSLSVPSHRAGVLVSGCRSAGCIQSDVEGRDLRHRDRRISVKNVKNVRGACRIHRAILVLGGPVEVVDSLHLGHKIQSVFLEHFFMCTWRYRLSEARF